MKQLLYFFLIFIILVSCQDSNSKTKDNKPVIAQTPSRTYTFSLDFIRHKANLGRFVKHDSSFFYFYHALYSKQIDIYNEQQEKVNSISLKKYQTNNNPIIIVQFLNSDTLSLTTKKGIVYLINSNTDLLKTIDVNVIQSQLNDTLLEVRYPIVYSDTYQGALISSFNGMDNPYGFDRYCDLLKYFMEKNVKTKRLVLIDNVFADSLIIHHSIEDLEQPILDSGCFANVMYETYFLKNKLIMYSDYSDKLYQISLINREIEKEISIKSKYPTSIVTPAMKIGEESKDCFNNMEKYALTINEGLINSVYYSSYTQKYYVAVRHKKQTESDKEKRYSILAYDKDFNKTGETDLMFNPVGIWSEKGVYIYCTEDNIGEKQIQLKYYEFIK